MGTSFDAAAGWRLGANVEGLAERTFSLHTSGTATPRARCV